MLCYQVQRVFLLYLAQILSFTLCLAAPAPLSVVSESTQLVQPLTNTTELGTAIPSTTDSTAWVDLLSRGPGYRYDVPNTNTWLKFRFHGQRKFEHTSLVMALISAIDEVRMDIKILGGGMHVNENKGPFFEHVPGCMFTISSTTNPDRVRRMTYSMRLDTLRGLYNVLVKAKREEAAEFIIYYEGLGLVGVGTIDKERRTRPA